MPFLTYPSFRWLTGVAAHVRRHSFALARKLGRVLPLSKKTKSRVRTLLEGTFSQRDQYMHKLQQELSIYRDQTNVNNLPRIHHYWSNKYLVGIFREAGIQSIESFFSTKLIEAARRAASDHAEYASIGSGNCDLESAIAKSLLDEGHRSFTIDCIDINPAMLARGAQLAKEKGVSQYVGFCECDFNTWSPSKKYDAIIANQSLHHVTDLEHLYEEVHRSLKDDGSFIISDMIGRNGHQRWPESLEIVHQFWQELPEAYRHNISLNRHEAMYENFDCSGHGFEGVRSQDVLPLLLQAFVCEMFVGFGSAIDVFVDRSFGHHFNPDADWDRNFIDRVHAADEHGLREGKLTPTHMLGVFAKKLHSPPIFSRGISPESAIRKP